MLSENSILQGVQGPVEVQNLRQGEKVLALTTLGLSFVEVQGVTYQKAPIRGISLETEEGRILGLTEEQEVFFRFVSKRSPYDVVLVRERGVGAYVLSGKRGPREGSGETFFYRVLDQEQGSTDEVFLLGSFPEESRARFLKKFIAARFGIPESFGEELDPNREDWLRLFHEIDTLGRSRELLAGYGLDSHRPHWVQRNLTRLQLRRHLFLSAKFFRGEWHVDVGKPKVRTKAFDRIPKNQVGETLRDLSSYEGLDHVDIERSFELGWPWTYRCLPATGLQPGMAIPFLEDDKRSEQVISKVMRSTRKGLVYRLELGDVVGFPVDGVLLAGSLRNNI